MPSDDCLNHCVWCGDWTFHCSCGETPTLDDGEDGF